MENVLLGVAAMSLIIIVGLIVSVFYSKNKVQGRASAWAFASLAIVFVLFCFIVVLGSQRWILPAFIIACTVVPIGAYVAVVSRMQQAVSGSRGKHTTGKAAKDAVGQAGRTQPPRVVHPGIRAEVVDAFTNQSGVATAREKPVFASQSIVADSPAPPKKPVQHIPEPPSYEAVALEGTEEAIDPESVVVYDALAASYEEEALQELEDAGASAGEDVSVDLEPFALQPDERLDEDAGEAKLESDAVAIEAAQEPEAEPESQCEQEPEAERDAVSVAATQEPEAERGSDRDEGITYERCLDKAATFKDKGLEGIAARLYKQAAQLASDEEAARNALMLAMASYVNADLPHEALAVAHVLSEDAQKLTPVQRMKLDAVMRLA